MQLVNKDWRPNIILIVMDTCRADHMSVYGYNRRTTPNLERWAENGLVFTNCWSTSKWTLPAHASLFTGLYPSQHQCSAAQPFLDPALTSLPELLHAAGYRTVGISCNGLISRATGFARGFETFYECFTRLPFRDGGPIGGHGIQKIARWAGLMAKAPRLALAKVGNRFYRALFPSVCDDATPYTRRAVRVFIETLERESGSMPLFVFMNLMQTHTQYNPPPATRGEFGGRHASRKLLPEEALWYTFPRERRVAMREELQALYDEEMLYLDRVVGEALAAAARLASRRPTWVIITADHGEALGEDDLFGHFFLHETTARVPMLLWLFPRGPTGRKNGLGQLTDVFATIVNIAGLPWPVPRTSVSLLGGRRTAAVCQDFDAIASLDFVIRRAAMRGGKALVEGGTVPFCNHVRLTSDGCKWHILTDGNKGQADLVSLAGMDPSELWHGGSDAEALADALSLIG